MIDRMKEEKIIAFEKSLFKLVREHFGNYWWDVKCVLNDKGGIVVNINVKKEDK